LQYALQKYRRVTGVTFLIPISGKFALFSWRGAAQVLILSIAAACSGLLALQIPQLQQLASERYGNEAVATVVSWEALINSNKDTDVQNKLMSVNDFFNQRITWVGDEDAWNQTDYWATPLETMGRAVGDCEDFTIAKYATLLTLGLPPESLRLVYVKAKRNGLTQAHMVLAWYENPMAVPLILDNMDFVIRPANERGDLFPIFSFNADQLWMATQAQPTNSDPQARLSRWSQVLLRMRQEGFDLGS
jgi:predicted transglutaminase-like cysteine proteinase